MNITDNLLTLAMFPVLVVVYIRLAGQEEKLVWQKFGSAYDAYAKEVPAFLPVWRKIGTLQQRI